MNILEVRNLTKVYGTGESEVRALNDVSFDVEKGEFVAIIGPSGSGKSTLLHTLGVPAETVPLLLLRPFSGSAALAAAAELISRCGPDSLAGRTAAVMLGSSETTFYVTAVYFSAAGVRDSRWAIPAALCADLACFLSSAWICRLLWG